MGFYHRRVLEMAQAAQKKEEKVIPAYGAGKVTRPNAILLWSSLASTAHQQAAQTKMNNLFSTAHRLEQLDGAQGENKDLRNKLFNCSNVRGKYPQIFIVDAEDKLTYIGNDEAIQFQCERQIPADLHRRCRGQTDVYRQR